MTIRMLNFTVLLLVFNLLFLFACTPKTDATRQANDVAVGALTDPVRINSAWSAPSTITDNLITEYFGEPIHLSASADGVIFSAWEAHNTSVSAPNNFQIQFAMRSAFGTPWQLTGPNLTGFAENVLLAPRLHSHRDSGTVYASWYSPDHGLNTHYISRYQVATGWSEPVAFSDSEYSPHKVFFDASGKAVLLWATYAENTTVELHARLLNADGSLSLMRSLLLGKANQAGLFITNDFIDFDGWITETGELEVYAAIRSMGSQLWKSGLSIIEAGLSDWSPPEMIVDGFLQSKLQALHVFNHGQSNVLVIFHMHNHFANDPSIFSLESDKGNWGSLARIDETSPAIIGSAVASNPSGQVVAAWTDIDPESTAGAVRVFAAQYDPKSGWLPAVQISDALLAAQGVVMDGVVLSSDDAPKVDINSAGEIVVVWVKPTDETQNFYANYFDPNNGWGGEELAFGSTLARNHVNNYSVVINTSGEASIVWQQTEIRPEGAVQQVQFIDHVGRGNGVVNVVASAPVASIFNQQNALVASQYIRESKPPLSLSQRTERLLTISNPAPIRIKSPWNLPVMVDMVISEASMKIINPLDIITNDEGSGVINLVSLSALFPGKLNSNVWTGNALTGDWINNPPRLNADPDSIYIDDVELNSISNDIYIAWREICTVETLSAPCPELYVSRKSSLENWQAQMLVGESSKGGIDLVSNASGAIGSVWKVSPDANTNPGIAYSEFSEGSGWQTPDIFVPSINPADIKLQSHGKSQFPLSLSDNGTLSLLERYNAPSNFTLLQRDPVNGWTEAPLLSTLRPINKSTAYMNTNGIGDGVHLVFMAGNSSDDTILQSVQYSDGKWNPFIEINTPKLGDIESNHDSTLAAGNEAGVMLASWVERVRSGPGLVDQIRLSWYYPATGWTPPMDIGLPIRSMYNNAAPGMPRAALFEFLSVSINDSNEGVIAWVDNSSMQRKLNVVHLDPSKTELNNELIASLNGRISYFGAVDVHIDSQGRVALVWDEVTPQSTHDGHRIVTVTHHSEGVITPPDHPLPYLPSQSPNWSESQIVWEIPSGGSFVHRSNIEMNTSTPLLSVQVDERFSGDRNAVSSTEHLLATSDTAGVWKDETPFGQFFPGAESSAKVVSDPTTGAAFIAWLSQGLYLNARSTDGNWGTPQAIAPGVDWFYLLSNTRGQVVMLWQKTNDRSTVFVSEITVDSAGIMQVSPASPSTIVDTEIHGEPVFNHNGTVSLLRRPWSQSDQQSQELILTQYIWQNDWQVVSSQPLDASDFYQESVTLAVTSDTQGSNDQVVVFAKSKLNRKLHSRFLLPDETWTNWIAIDGNENQVAALMGQYRVGPSTNGQLYVLWVAESINDQNQPQHFMWFTRFDAAGLATDTPWLAAELISEIRHPNFHETPRLLVGNDDSVAVLWKHPVTPLADAIFIRKFQLASGWQQEPEIVAAFPISIKQNIKHINAALSERGVIVVTWQTLTGVSGFMQTISMSKSKM